MLTGIVNMVLDMDRRHANVCCINIFKLFMFCCVTYMFGYIWAIGHGNINPTIKICLRLFKAMEIVQKGCLGECWSTHWPNQVLGFNETMPRNRFLQILRRNNFVNDEVPSKSNKVWRVQYVIEVDSRSMHVAGRARFQYLQFYYHLHTNRRSCFHESDTPVRVTLKGLFQGRLWQSCPSMLKGYQQK